MKIYSKTMKEIDIRIKLPLTQGNPVLIINEVQHTISDVELVDLIQSIHKSNTPNEIIKNTKKLWCNTRIKKTINSILSSIAENKYETIY